MSMKMTLNYKTSLRKHVEAIIINMVFNTVECFGGKVLMDGRATDLKHAIERYVKEAIR